MKCELYPHDEHLAAWKICSFPFTKVDLENKSLVGGTQGSSLTSRVSLLKPTEMLWLFQHPDRMFIKVMKTNRFIPYLRPLHQTCNFDHTVDGQNPAEIGMLNAFIFQ